MRRIDQRRDVAVGRDRAHAIVAGIGHVERSALVDRETGRRVEARLAPASVCISTRVASHRRHDAVGVDDSNPIVVCVGDENPPGRVDSDADRAVEERVLNASLNAFNRASTGDGDHVACRRDAADRVVPGIGDIQRAVTVERQP